MPWTIATHAEPVWRKHANFIVFAKVDDTHWEQLWTQRLANHEHVLCCIPFFAYDLALGDVVTVQPGEGKEYVVDQVVKPSSHYTFRVRFGDTTDQVVRADVRALLRQEGCVSEWWSDNLLAIDAADQRIAQRVRAHLSEQETLGRLAFETGLLAERE